MSFGSKSTWKSKNTKRMRSSEKKFRNKEIRHRNYWIDRKAAAESVIVLIIVKRACRKRHQ